MAERRTSRSEQRQGQEMQPRGRGQGTRQPGSELSRRDFWPGLGTASPYALMRQMADEMDRLFEDVWFAGGPGVRSGLARPGLGAMGQGLWAPQVDVFEKDNNLVVQADLPGLKKEDVDIEIEQDALILTGERRQEHEEERQGVYRSERAYGRFQRAIPLPEGIKTEDVKATFRDGVLEVTVPLPAKRQARGRRVEIQ